MSVLRVTGIDVRRGGRTIVNGATLSADAGEVVALVGASGSGKTTVLRAIAGLEPLSAGSIAADGRVGMVFQFHYLFPHLSALENVTLAPIHVLRHSRAEAERRARDLLVQLDVEARAAAMPHELSGGEAQRVAIARALAVEPAVVLMDEPTASLDPARRQELVEIIRRLADGGRTFVIATHDAGFVEACARRVLMMAGGRIQ
jgi:ABC-type polar amino acid transport system ATPase subunit